MESQNKRHSEQFLQQHLQQVIALLEKQRQEESLVQRGPAARQALVEIFKHKQQQTRLQKEFAQLHPADIAYILESLPLDQRRIAWNAIRTDIDGQVLLEVSDAVRQTLISGMGPEELATVAGKLDSDEIADLAADLPQNAMQRILKSLNHKKRRDLNAVLACQEDQVGSRMDFGTIKIRDDLTLAAIADYIRKRGKLPGHTDQLFVVDHSNKIKGVLPLQRLLTHPPSQQVAEVMVTDFIAFPASHDLTEAARAFERYDLISAPVVDNGGRLLGRLCIDNIVDFIREETDEDLLIQAGVEEEEDLFSSIWKSARNRWGWLLINITTAFAATRIIDMFENTILHLVALASLMPIIASTGGNTGNQTSMLIIRSLALGQITRGNIRRLITKELSLAILNGILLGGLVGALVWLLYRDRDLALVMTIAMFINLQVAALVGLGIPLLRYKLGKDPALGTSVMLTFITDAMGFFIFLGLASVFLLEKT